jgi:hypothetical protein
MWREWSIKTKAYGGKKGWAKALLSDLKHLSITKADQTVRQENYWETNNDGWNHLVLACMKRVHSTSSPHQYCMKMHMRLGKSID